MSEAEILKRIKELVESRDNKQSIPVIDPTANVLSLVGAAMNRQDDLRDAENRRIDDLRNLQSQYDTEIRRLRANFQSELSAAESKRIDALATAESRRLDAVLAGMKADVALASEKAGATAATLAASVASTASATASQINELRNTLEKRLATVEQNQYQGAGAQIQRTEGRKDSQWVVGTIIVAGFALVEVLIHLLHL